MEYCNKFRISKLILLLLSLSLMLSLFACGGEEDSSDSEASDDNNGFSVETAKALLERDRLITEMFVCNSLVDTASVSAVRETLSEGSEYSSFSEIETLLASTYTSEGKEPEFFLSYPLEFEPSISNDNGKTSVFCHSGGGYSDFPDMSTVSFVDTDNESVKTITAKTLNGNDISLKAVLSNGNWLLEKGIYNSYPPANIGGEYGAMPSRLGSMSSFSGRILVIELFVSDNETEFTEEEEEAFHRKIKSAVDYVSEYASEYDITAEIEYKAAYFDHDGILGDRCLDFDVMFAETGFGTLKAFAEANYDLTQYDNYFFAVCLNKNAETDCSVYENTAETEIYTAEKVFMGTASSDSEICVSLLKLLGAYDYSEGRCGEYTENLYSVYFPDDIMISKNLHNAVLSPVTAYAIGIKQELEPLYRVFIY